MRRIGPGTQQRIDRLRSEVQELPDEAKRKVARATKWTCGSLVGRDGARCLIGHAEVSYYNSVGVHNGRSMAADFDALSLTLGLSATVALVKDALGVLK